MRDRPIIFSAPMVRALLDGRKTQTRRVAYRPDEWVMAAYGTAIPKPTPWMHIKPGARLWVREAYAAPCLMETQYRADPPSRHGHWNGALGPWKSPIHMPRWASRITLHVEAVRVQRLQDISEEDARAEGVTPAIEPPTAAALMTAVGRGAVFMPHRSAFANLWNSLHGPDAWAANPEVVALTFRVTKGNIDAA